MVKRVVLETWDILSTIGLAAAPVGELRAAIPIAVIEFGFPWYAAMGWALMGNLIPVLIIPWGLYFLGHIMLRFPQPIRGLLVWRTQRLVGRDDSWLGRYGVLGLVPFVAIPLPFTGAWMGCLAAWALELPPRRSMPFLALGVIVSAVIVTILTKLGISLTLFLGRQLE